MSFSNFDFNDVLNVMYQYRYSEKNVDCQMLIWYSELFENTFNFKQYYSTGNNPLLFGNLIPDGYDIIAKTLIIFENKRKSKQFNQAKKQIDNYVRIATTNYEFKNVVQIIGYEVSLQKRIFINFVESSENDFVNLLKQLKPVKRVNNFDIHIINQWLYDNKINFGSVETKTLKLSLLCLLVKNLNDYIDVKKYILTLTIDRLNNDIKQFFNYEFQEYELKNIQYILNYFNEILIDYRENDILTKIFNEVLIWNSYEHVDTNAEGTVITPNDIAYLTSLWTTPNTKKIYDPCCGSGALICPFLNSNYQIRANELNKNRYNLLYLLTKQYSNIKTYNYDAFKLIGSIKSKVDYIVMNPPYTTDHLHLKFVLSHLRLLNNHGRMCVIFPQSSINNNTKFMNILRKHTEIIATIKLNDNVFEPMASVSTVILVLERVKQPRENYEFKAYDFVNDGCEFIGKGKTKMRIKTQNIELNKFQMININSNNWVYNLVSYKIPKQNEFQNYYIDHIKGYAYHVLMNECMTKINSNNTQTNNYTEIIKIESNKTIQEQKLLIYTIYKLKNGNIQDIPFNYYIDELKINSQLKLYFKNLISGLSNANIKTIINEFTDDNYDINLNIDSKNGIVFTNPMIVKNMNSDLCINNNDKYLDFCCGSGNFIFDAVNYNPKKLIGVEIDTLLSNICNLKALTFSNIKFINDDCFKCQILKPNTFTKIAINPPFGVNISVIDFIKLGIKTLKPNGLMCFLIPSNMLRNQNFMKELKKETKIIKIVNYNNTMFKLSGIDIETSHCLIKKCVNNSDYNFETFKFDSGYDIIHGFKKIYSEPKMIGPVIKNINSTDWNYENEIDVLVNDDMLKLGILKQNIMRYIQQLKIDVPQLEQSKFKKIKLGDYFKNITTNKKHKSDEQMIIGKYPLIGAAKINNGCIGYLNTYDYDGEAYTIATTGNGGAGYMFYQPKPFNTVSSVFVLKCKTENFNYKINCPLISYQLHEIQGYNRYKTITKSNFESIECWIYDDSNIEILNFDFKFNGININQNQFKKIKLSDYFKNITTNKKHKTGNSQNQGEYPLIGAAKKNNGYVGYLDTYDYNGGVCTIATTGNGGAGYMFYQPKPFNITASVFVLECRIENFNYEINCPLISYQLHEIQGYSRHKNITKSNFDNIECWIYNDSV